MQVLYRWFTALLFAAVAVQVGLAGYGIFNAVHEVDDKGSITKKSFEDGFNVHAALGTIIVVAMLVLFVASAAGRLGQAKLKWTGGLFALGILQMLFAGIGSSVPALGFLHPVNALAIFAVSGVMAHRAWVVERRTVGEPEPLGVPAA